MNAKLFDDMATNLVIKGKHVDGSMTAGNRHTEHYLYDGAIYIIDYNSDNAPFRIISTKINRTFRHPTRNDK